MHDDEPRYKPKRRSILITSPFPSPRRSNYPVPQQPDEPIEVSTVSSPHIIQELTARLNTITSTLESAFELSRTLQAQHASAQSTIATLESKVSSLEALVLERTPPTPTPAPLERETIADMLADWKKGVEGQWTDVKEEWTHERARLNKAREDWESKTKVIESNLGGVIARVDSGLASIVRMQQQQQAQNGNANNGAHLGLITPPSPRRLSVDSSKARHRRRWRSRSRSRVADDSDVDGSSTLYSSSVPSSPGLKAEEEDVAERSLATPESYRRPTLVDTLSTQPTKELLQSRKDVVRCYLSFLLSCTDAVRVIASYQCICCSRYTGAQCRRRRRSLASQGVNWSTDTEHVFFSNIYHPWPLCALYPLSLLCFLVMLSTLLVLYRVCNGTGLGFHVFTTTVFEKQNLQGI